MLAVPEHSVRLSAAKLASTGFGFVLQQAHLTSDSYDYGVTFISEHYVRTKWLQLFFVENTAFGGIHDFQDIVVLRRP
jgi:hypothetical protein